MRSSKDVLPGEDGALYEKRRRDAHAKFAPRDATEAALVDRTSDSSGGANGASAPKRPPPRRTSTR
jgi:hypothetical protein